MIKKAGYSNVTGFLIITVMCQSELVEDLFGVQKFANGSTGSP